MIRDLANGDRTVGELAQPFAMSLAAASKHIKVLESAGLIRREIRWRTHVCRPEPGPLAKAHDWLASTSGSGPTGSTSSTGSCAREDAARPTRTRSPDQRQDHHPRPERTHDRDDRNRRHGVLIEPATLKIERLLPGPIERVWATLTKATSAAAARRGRDDARGRCPFDFIWRNDELTDPPGERPEGMSVEHRMASGSPSSTTAAARLRPGR